MSTLTTTTRSASAHTPKALRQGLPEGYAFLFFAAAAPPPSKHAVTHSRGVPLETFIAVMHLVRDGSERDLVQATHVCAGWRRAILECGQLWSDLDQVNVVDYATVDRVRAVASRAKDNLRRIVLTFDVVDDLSLCTTIAIVVKQIFREVSRSGARGLKELVVDMRPLVHLMEDLEPAYNVVVLAVHFAEFSAVNLRTLKVLTPLDRFPTGAPFFFSLPDLDKLVVTSSPGEPYGDARLPDFFSTSASLGGAQLTSCALTRLVLRGTSLMDSTFPSFPQLRDVKFFSVRVCNLYGLLTSAPRIERLWLRGVQTDPANRFLPPTPGGGNKDVPPPLECVLLSLSFSALLTAPADTGSRSLQAPRPASPVHRRPIAAPLGPANADHVALRRRHALPRDGRPWPAVRLRARRGVGPPPRSTADADTVVRHAVDYVPERAAPAQAAHDEPPLAPRHPLARHPPCRPRDAHDAPHRRHDVRDRRARRPARARGPPEPRLARRLPPGGQGL